MGDVFRGYESGDDVRVAFDQTGRIIEGKFLCDEGGKARIGLELKGLSSVSKLSGRCAMLVDYVYVRPAAGYPKQ